MNHSREILFPYAGDTFGGSNVSSLLLVKELKKAGLRLKVGLHSEGILVEYLQTIDVSWVRLPPLEKRHGFVGFQKNVFRLKKYIEENNIGLIHTNDRRMLSPWVLAAKLAGAHHVWHQRNRLDSRMGNCQAYLSTQIISITKYCQDSLHPLNKRKSVVIRNPVYSTVEPRDVEAARSKIIQRSRAAREPVIVGFFSYWVKRKRPDVFVEVAAHLVALTDRPVVFAMFGETKPEMAEVVLSGITKRGLEEVFQIWQTKIPVEPWIAACDFVVAPAVNEGMGRVLIEAMQLGTLVLASATGGHLEIVEDGRTGMLFSPGEPRSCAKKIAYLLERKDQYREITERAKLYSRDAYSLQRHANEVREQYGKLA